MSAMGFLVRWGSMALGGVLLVGGVGAALSYAPRSETPRAVTPQEALSLAGQAREVFVSLDAPLDEQTLVHESYLATPRFISVDTNQVHTLRPGKDGAGASLVGATVRAQDALEDGRIECQLVRQDSNGSSLQSMVVLSPLSGTDGQVWVASPRFQTEGEADNWQARGWYQGPLSRFDDLEENAPHIGYSAQAVREYALENLNVRIPQDATLLIDGQGLQDGGAARESYSVVSGTEGNLIVRRGSAASSKAPSTGALVGMLEAQPVPRELATLIGSSDPERAMVLDTTRTAASENAKDLQAMRVGLIGGGALFAFGAGTTYLKHRLRRFRRLRREQAAAMGLGLSPAQAMALGIPMPGVPAPHTPNPFEHQRQMPTAFAIPSRRIPTGHTPAPIDPGSRPDDAALEAEMAKWTQPGSGRRAG